MKSLGVDGMKIAVVTDAMEISIKEASMPLIKDNEVLIKVACSGICGSDVALYKGEHPFRKPPVIPGHEISGEIMQVGKQVRDYQVGERVVVNHTIPCGDCRYCLTGLANVCPTKIYAGSTRMMGFFAQYVNVPASTLFRINSDISNENAAMAEPLSVGFHIINRLKQIKQVSECNQTLVIIGTGTIGLLSLIVAQKQEYKKIICIDPLEHNLDVASKFGATNVLNATNSNIVDILKELTDGYGASSTIITAAVPGILTQACALTDIMGTMIFLPMTRATLDINIYDLVAKEQHLIGCRGILKQDFADAVDLINSGFDFSPMISHILSLEHAWMGFQLMINRPIKEKVIKILVCPNK